LPSPSQLGAWWMDTAVSIPDDRFACEAFAYGARMRLGEYARNDALLEQLAQRVQSHMRFSEVSEYVRSCPIDDWRGEQAREHKVRAEKFRRYQVALLATLEKSRSVAVPVGTLYQLYWAYQGHHDECPQKVGLEAIEHLIGGSADGLAKAHRALFDIALRGDWPTATDLLAAYPELRLYSQTLLLSMRLRFLVGTHEVDQLPEAVIETALTQFFRSSDDNENDAWVDHLLSTRSDTSWQVIVEYAKKMWGISESASSALRAIAKSELPNLPTSKWIQLLDIFPLRASGRMLSDIPLLIRGLLPSITTENSRCLRARCDANSDVEQKCYWLTALAVLFNGEGLAQLTQLVDANVTHLTHVRECISQLERSDVTSVALTSQFIELFARHCAPRNWGDSEDGRVTDAMNQSDFVRGLINNLTQKGTVESRDELQRLSTLDSITTWWSQLDLARSVQQVVLRNDQHKIQSAAAFQATLASGLPSSHADLFHLVLDEIDDLCVEIENGPNDGRLQFWNVDPYGRAIKPRAEPICRNYFAERMRDRLNVYSVDCVRERSHAGTNASDIWCSWQQKGIPIEAKSCTSRELWTAIGDQLLPKYTTDPSADGYGIYLVFWFGVDSCKARNRSKPLSSGELADWLVELIPANRRGQVRIRVLDVSSPSRA